MTKEAIGETFDILLIEDNPGDARLLEELLEETPTARWKVEWSRELSEALQRLGNAADPDAVLLDLHLPDSRGLETVRRVTGRAPDVPVVVLTGDDDEETGPAAVREGAQDFLRKGEVSPQDLGRALRYALLRMRTERTLRRRERRFRTLVSNLSDVISVIDRDGRVLYQSPSVERVLGYEPEELEGEDILQYFHPEDRTWIGEQLGKLTQEPSGEAFGEARFRHADGSWRVLQARGRMPPEEGDIDGVIIVSRDVTQQVQRSKELERATASLRERVKEQSCLYDVARYLHADDRELGDRLRDVVDRLPEGWQYPEITAARLEFGDESWTTGGVSETAPALSMPVAVEDDRIGRLTVCYVEERPEEDLGPFISEEKQLLEAIAEQVGVALKRHNSQRAVEQAKRRYQTLFEESPVGVAVVSPEGKPVEVNEQLTEMLGYEREELVGTPFPEFTHPDDVERDLELYRRLARGKISDYQIEKRYLTANGEVVWGDLRVTSVRLPGHERQQQVAFLRDITDRKAMEQQLRHRALHDGLTGLPNRSLFDDRLQQALARGHRHGEVTGLLMLDVDRFKQINDALGHTAGDRVLEEIARRLQNELRGEDTAARLGGDEFVVLLPALSGIDAFATVRDRLVNALSEPFLVGGKKLEVDITMGGVLQDGDEVDPAVAVETSDDLLRYADLALFEAKREPGSSFHLFHPKEDVEKAEALGREQELRRAIREEEFEVVFQPIYRLRGGELWGLEPLARWRHPERGLLPPGDFIPLAEETGLIRELGQLLLREACCHAAGWPERDGRAVRVTPNLSGRQFDEEGFPERLRSIVEASDLAPERFSLEITETAITRATGQVESLREMGFRVLVDDFGTGFSSFDYLRDLRFDGLKIDMSFVQALDGNGASQGLVETMITMGRTMEMIVVAEGIESELQREILTQLGCELGQGFLLDRPMPADEVQQIISGQPETD